jgi:nucleoside 2-deoxyribosyltransferase
LPKVSCPICENKWGGTCDRLQANFDGGSFSCECCGQFKVSGTVLEDNMLQTSRKFDDQKRGALSHFVKTNQIEQSHPPMITSDWFEQFLKMAELPSPAIQANNIIKYIGEQVLKSGGPVDPALGFYAVIGSPNPNFAMALVEELIELSLLTGREAHSLNKLKFGRIGLTLKGWDLFEKEKQGEISGSYGFMAMKFNDEKLEPFVATVVKPAVAEMGFSLFDLRDVARSGIIDNIMRDQIRDSAFVIVDLTHDNSGAYWEAGYAEGLGKPVLYICEQSKFDLAKTHFDTNHCTTVTWGGTKENDRFAIELKATLRNSLRVLPR